MFCTKNVCVKPRVVVWISQSVPLAVGKPLVVTVFRVVAVFRDLDNGI